MAAGQITQTRPQTAALAAEAAALYAHGDYVGAERLYRELELAEQPEAEAEAEAEPEPEPEPTTMAPAEELSQMEELFQHVQTFDTNRDGYIDEAEMKLYLVAVRAWGSEGVYTDAKWSRAWPGICKMMRADSAKGLPLESFEMFHERYRRGELAHDLRQLSKHHGRWVKLFDCVAAFDENKDGFIDAPEMKAYLTAVGAWDPAGDESAAQMEALFQHVLAFDENDDGFIDGAEMKRYLVAVGAWGSEDVYSDARWPRAWPGICEILQADAARGLPLASFEMFHGRYRRGKLAHDLNRLSSGGSGPAEPLYTDAGWPSAWPAKTRAHCHSSLPFAPLVGVIHTNENGRGIMTDGPRRSRPAIVKLLGGDGDRGLAIGHFKRYHDAYRPGKLESDLERLVAAEGFKMPAPQAALLARAPRPDADVELVMLDPHSELLACDASAITFGLRYPVPAGWAGRPSLAGLDEGLLSLYRPHSRLYGESL
jgi:Ca2+-binding EF-hand superfamily protein